MTVYSTARVRRAYSPELTLVARFLHRGCSSRSARARTQRKRWACTAQRARTTSSFMSISVCNRNNIFASKLLKLDLSRRAYIYISILFPSPLRARAVEEAPTVFWRFFFFLFRFLVCIWARLCHSFGTWMMKGNEREQVLPFPVWELRATPPVYLMGKSV